MNCTSWIISEPLSMMGINVQYGRLAQTVISEATAKAGA